MRRESRRAGPLVIGAITAAWTIRKLAQSIKVWVATFTTEPPMPARRGERGAPQRAGRPNRTEQLADGEDERLAQLEPGPEGHRVRARVAVQLL